MDTVADAQTQSKPENKTMNIDSECKDPYDHQNDPLFVERQLFLGEAGKYENVRITKNVVIIGIAFMLHFTAFHGTANLQSSINANDSLGTYTLAALYGSLILSNIFLPVAVIRALGCKWTIALSFISYMPFILAQFYPRMYTLIPAGIIAGLGGGPLWCAKCTYLTVIAEATSTLFSNKNGKRADAYVVRFFGLFFTFYQMAQVWGNLLSSSVLSYGDDTNSFINESVLAGIDFDLLHNVSQLCGAQFCPGISAVGNENLIPPDMKKIQMLSVLFLSLMIGACVLVAIGVDSLKRYEMGRKGSGSGLSGVRLLAVTAQQLMQMKQVLLLPITMYIGAEQAFIAVDFTASFVACGWGISRIGYVMISFGVANAIAACLAGGVSKIIGRNKILAFTLVLHGALLIWMRQWTAVPNDFISYCSMAAIWGLVDGIWLVTINSYYGTLFPGKEEAAFSNFRLFEATGSVITYILSPLLCSDTKIISLFVLMIVGIIGYIIVEYLKSKGESDAVDKSITNYKKAGEDTRM